MYTAVLLFTDIMNNCARDGGYCINVIPPAPPAPPRQPKRRQQPRRKGTRTRKGQRRGSNKPKPNPLTLSQQHTRLPAAAGGGPAAPRTPVRPQQQQQQQAPVTNRPFSFFDNLFGPGPSDPFASMFGMSMLMRKKRQAPLEPSEIAEMPRIRRGENMFNFLNTNCRKSEFDFGCRNTGGMCCLPPLKK